ncbi:MAG: hypothetical protein KatS3mg105_5020 [Gemmatales bacterium]|nr:MAG: hypothetical protein KatS3mg105_5020 [Gemmatales bacterium]
MALQKLNLGYNAKLYRNTGTFSTPVWTVIDNVKDLTVTLQKEEVESNYRASSPWKTSEPTLIDLSVNWQMAHDKDDTNWQAIRDAFFNNNIIELLVIDRDVTVSGAQGVRFRCKVFNFTKTETLNGLQTWEVMVKPVMNDNGPPSWYVTP